MPDLRRTVSLMTRARRLLGWGAASIDVRPLFFGDDVLPQMTEAVSGYEVVDTDGRRHIDWFGRMCNLLGYREPRVEEAIRRQMAEGPVLPLVHPLEVDVAELLVEMVPCAEMVAFGKNGSDGVTAAVRLARLTTGRDVILHYGYHGFHDWFTAGGELLQAFPYNDLAALRALMQRFDGRVAAIVMEPVRDALPAPGYLAEVKRIAHDAGALLIFDEVVTALRLGNGGAQTAFGVVPDLACLGKCMGNGMPLSAIAGPRELMREFPRTEVGMTFQGETLSLAAARTVLQIARDEPVAERIAATGEVLRARFDATAMRLGVDASLTGHPARLEIRFAARGDVPAEYLLAVFMTEAMRRGVITGPQIFPSYAHDDVAVERTAEAFDGALELVARTADAPFRGWILPGEPEVAGWLDGEDSGWILIDGGAAEELAAATLGGDAIEIARAHRADVAAAHPDAIDAASSGFTLRLPAGETAVLIVARRGPAVARCVVDWSDTTLPLPLRQGRVSGYNPK